MKRRSSRTLVVSAVVAACLLGAATGYAAVGAPWAQSDANAAHSRANTSETTLSPTTVDQVRYLRSLAARPTPPSSVGCVRGVGQAPVLADGHLYAILENHLAAFDLTSGARLWTTPLDVSGTTLYVGLAVSGGHVVVGEEDCLSQSDPDGFVQSFDAATGQSQWRVAASPLVGALLDVVVSGSRVVNAGGAPSSTPYVAVRSLATGAVVWFKTACQLFPLPAVVEDGLVFVNRCDADGFSHPRLVAARLSDGAVLWTKPGFWSIERGDSDGTNGVHLYAQHAGVLTDINPATGAVRYTIPGTDVRALAVDSARLYATCSAGLCTYARGTGALLWSTPVDPSMGTAQSAVADGVVYLPDGRALRASDGSLLTTLWVDRATQISVGDGHVAAVTDPRIVDVYGLAGG